MSVYSQRRNKRRGTGLAIMCCCPLIKQSQNACESWFCQQRCAHWSGRFLQQKAVSPTLLAGCGSKKLWQSEEQQLEIRNHPHEFHSGALPWLLVELCISYQKKREKRLKNKQASSFSCFGFVFHMCMNILNK